MANLEYDIQPYVGALPIRFDMARSDVTALFDERLHSRHEDADSFGSVRVAYYGADTVAEISFVPRAVVLRFMGTELWNDQKVVDPIPVLLRHDPYPVEFVGFLVFPRIGVTATGFHDDDYSQRAITVFRRGHWDESLPSATKPNLAKYRIEPGDSV